MAQINLFSLAGFALAACCLLLAIFVRIFAQSKSHKIWALFNACVAAWGLGAAFAGISPNAADAIYNWRFAHASSTFIAVIFYYFVHTFCEFKRKRFLTFCFIFGAVYFLLILCTDFYFTNGATYILNSIYMHNACLGYNIWFGIWGFIVTATFVELWRFARRTDGIKKTQALFIFWGMLLGFAGGSSTLLPPWGIIIVYPAYHFSICIYSFIMTYAIFKHHLIDIKRGLVYSILITLISLIDVLIIILFERKIQVVLGYSSVWNSFAAAFVIAVIFLPLRNAVQHFVDRVIFKGTSEEIAMQNELLKQQIAQAEKYRSFTIITDGIANEIKNPLTTLTGYSHFLKQKRNDPEFIDKFTSILNKELTQIGQLVNQLTDYGKAAPLEYRKADIVKLLDETLVSLKSKLSEHNIDVTKYYEKEDFGKYILGLDPGQIQQALVNIFMNAIEAMPTNGYLRVGIAHTKDQFKIIISDTGPGINNDDIQRIFDPFFSTKEGHTGLGLASVQAIIEKHLGKVSAKSKPGCGTEITIELPFKGG